MSSMSTMSYAKTLIITGVILTSGISAGFCFGPPRQGSRAVGASPEKRAAINKSLDLYTQAGNAMEVEKNYPKAEALFRKALALNPSNPFLKQGLADALLAQGSSKAALSAYHETIHPAGTTQSADSDPLTLNRYLELCKDAGDVREVAWAERQIVVQASHVFNNYPRVTEDQLGSLPVSTLAQLAVGLAYHRQGENDKALKIFTIAAQEKPNLAIAHLYKAQSLERKLGFGAADAKTEYKKAYQLGDASVRSIAQQKLTPSP